MTNTKILELKNSLKLRNNIELAAFSILVFVAASFISGMFELPMDTSLVFSSPLIFIGLHFLVKRHKKREDQKMLELIKADENLGERIDPKASTLEEALKQVD